LLLFTRVCNAPYRAWLTHPILIAFVKYMPSWKNSEVPCPPPQPPSPHSCIINTHAPCVNLTTMLSLDIDLIIAFIIVTQGVLALSPLYFEGNTAPHITCTSAIHQGRTLGNVESLNEVDTRRLCPPPRWRYTCAHLRPVAGGKYNDSYVYTKQASNFSDGSNL
jgi:hypothetical protein